MIEIGVCVQDMTPRAGIPLVGFANRDVSTGVHDAILATALVASSGAERAAIVDCDLLYVMEESTARIRAEVQKRTGIPGGNVAIACTHTHYGPDTCWNVEHPLCRDYLGRMEKAVADAVAGAAGAMRPVRMGVGWGSSDIGINRRERGENGHIRLGRNPSGPIDRSVGVCRMDGPDGAPVAAIVNFATHPVTLSSRWRELSADYPGVVRRIVRQLTGAPCLFLQGACGNINPVRMEADFEAPRSLGTRLGCEAVRVWETVAPEEAGGVAVARSLEQLPRYRFGTRERAERRVRELEELLARQRSDGSLEGLVGWTVRRLERARLSVRAWRGEEEAARVAAELWAARIGLLHIATAPAEVFTELGLRVKSSGPRGRTFFASNANGAVGYVPVREAYGDGGYEVDDACQVDAEAGETLARVCTALVRRVSSEP